MRKRFCQPIPRRFDASIFGMSPLLAAMIERCKTWPHSRQNEAAALLRLLESGAPSVAAVLRTPSSFDETSVDLDADLTAFRQFKSN